MQDDNGSFFCFVVRSPSVAGWLLARTKSGGCERLIQEKLDLVVSSWEDECALNDRAGSFAASSGSDGLRRESIGLAAPLEHLPKTQSYVLPGGGLTVRMGLAEVADQVWRVTPYVYTSPDNSAVVAFTGYLSNLHELAAAYGKSRGSVHSPVSVCAATAAAAAVSGDDEAGGGYGGYGGQGGGGGRSPQLERRRSIDRSLDVGALTAAVLLAMYQSERPGHEAILLSELQGQYAFVIYDSNRRQAFAARDPSGDEPLWVRLDDDGAACFASSPDDIPPGERRGPWRPLPPGHYVAGRSPAMHQFALTPAQLVAREAREALGGGGGGGGYDGAIGFGGVDLLAAALQRRASLDEQEGNNGGGDGSVFTIEV